MSVELPETAESVLSAEPPSAARSPRRSSVVFLVGTFAGGQLLARVLGALGGLLQARVVAPSVLGLFGGIGLVQGYIPFLQAGILNGLNRELPYFIGKGERSRAEQLAAAAQAWAVLLGVVVAGALLAIAGWHLACGRWEMSAGWAANAIMAFVLFYGTCYLQVTYRTSHDFARLAMVQVVQNALGLVLVALVVLMNFYGICLRATIMAITSTAMFYYWRPLRVGPRWNTVHWKHLFVIGAPIFVVGQVYAWWLVINSTLVLAFTGIKGMGLYAMVTTTAGMLELLPSSVSQILYPRMAERFGRTGELNDLLKMAVKPTLFTVAGMILLVAAAWWLADPAVRIVLPRYVEAVPAMQWTMLSAVIESLLPIANVFNVVRRQRAYLAAILIGMSAYGVSLIWLTRGDVALVVFPQAMLIGQTAFALACYAIIFRLKREHHAIKAAETGAPGTPPDDAG